MLARKRYFFVGLSIGLLIVGLTFLSMRGVDRTKDRYIQSAAHMLIFIYQDQDLEFEACRESSAEEREQFSGVEEGDIVLLDAKEQPFPLSSFVRKRQLQKDRSELEQYLIRAGFNIYGLPVSSCKYWPEIRTRFNELKASLESSN